MLLFGVILLTPFISSCEEDEPIIYTESGSTGSSSSGNSSNKSTQCHAFTQKGERCKRMVADGGYYCWQHR